MNRKLPHGVFGICVSVFAACSPFGGGQDAPAETSSSAPLADVGPLEAGPPAPAATPPVALADTDLCNVEAGDVCLDFEDSTSWKYVGVKKAPGTLEFDEVKPWRGSKSAHFKKLQAGKDQAQATLLVRQLPFHVGKCDFMLWFQHTGTGSIEMFANYRYAKSPTGFLSYEALGMVHEGKTPYSHMSEARTGPLPNSTFAYNSTRLPSLDAAMGHWVRVETDVSKSRSQVTLGGTTTVTKPTLWPADEAEESTLIFGMNYESDASDTWEIFIDDVRCRRATP